MTSRLTEKDSDAGKDGGQEEKGATEDEMVGWHHQLNGHEFGQTLGDRDGQGGLSCYVHGAAELDMAEQLKNNSNSLLPTQQQTFNAFSTEFVELLDVFRKK